MSKRASNILRLFRLFDSCTYVAGTKRLGKKQNVRISKRKSLSHFRQEAAHSSNQWESEIMKHASQIVSSQCGNKASCCSCKEEGRWWLHCASLLPKMVSWCTGWKAWKVTQVAGSKWNNLTPRNGLNGSESSPSLLKFWFWDYSQWFWLNDDPTHKSVPKSQISHPKSDLQWWENILLCHQIIFSWQENILSWRQIIPLWWENVLSWWENIPSQCQIIHFPVALNHSFRPKIVPPTWNDLKDGSAWLNLFLLRSAFWSAWCSGWSAWK